MKEIANSVSTRATSLSLESFQREVDSFTLDAFHDPQKVDAYADFFGLRDLCRSLEADRLSSRASGLDRAVAAVQEKPFEPQYQDLCRLHWLILRRKAVNVLEFGSGFSTAVMAHAARHLREHYGAWAASNIRCDRPFHIFSVEEDQGFLNISKARLGSVLSDFATISRSSVELVTHDSRIATLYSSLPNISPDFIYLDGPSQYATTQEVNGFSFNSRARMPMSADILRFEFFLEPGTLVLVDGRTQNARFLKSYLRRNWIYQHDPVGDVHYFELQESPLGRFNQAKLDFCLGGKWLLQ